MAFPEKLLNGNENVILDLHPHWGGIVKPAATLLGVCAIWLWLALTTDVRAFEIIMGVLVGYVFIKSLKTYLHWINEAFILTTERVIHRRGVFQKNTFEIPLQRINTVTVQQSWVERILTTGKIHIEYSGDQVNREFKQFPQPLLIQKEINNIIDKIKKNGMD